MNNHAGVPAADADRTGEVVEPETRCSMLCTRDSRRGGAVTVGDSRIPAAAVLDTIRVRGSAVAAVMWPELSIDDLAVFQILVADLGIRAARNTVSAVAADVNTPCVD